jgi:D-alanine-D-alanine ligase
MKRRHVAVLRGGPSEEYEVSLKSGARVLEALRETDYITTDITITKGGEWLIGGRVKRPTDALAAIDVVFIALHGAYGEDGTVQRLIERLGIPYTGSTSYASAIAMNKAITKHHLAEHPIMMPKHMRLSREEIRSYRASAESIQELFGTEYVVKPVRGGSSIGTHFATGTDELAIALERALSVYDEVLVEERISGREVTVGVVENFRNEHVYTFPVIEIVPPASATFFDYNAKYSGQSEEICPGRFSYEESKRILEAARTVHGALGLRHYSRSDFIVKDGIPYFLEVNTLPGITNESLIIKGIDAVGASYTQFIEHLLEQAQR